MNNQNFKVGDLVLSDTGHFGTVSYIYTGALVAVDFDRDAPLGVSNGNVFSTDGRQHWPDTGKARLIRKITIDPRKVTKLTNGKAVTLKSPKPWDAAFEKRAVLVQFSDGWWYDLNTGEFDGVPGNPKLVNPAAPAPSEAPTVDWSKPLQTRDGRSVLLVGELKDGRCAVTATQLFGAAETYIVHADGRVSDKPGRADADDIVNPTPPPPKVTRRFINVYEDGTRGAAAHATFERAMKYSKLGKVRIGIIERVYHDAVLHKSVMHPTTPQLRKRNEPTCNPYEGR